MNLDKPKQWLLLIHQIPPKPDYFRVKIWRRLQQVGAVAIKQSVYVMPRSEQAYEDLNWILKEVLEGGGEASLSEAAFLEGITDDDVTGMFRAARAADYDRIITDARRLSEGAKNAAEGVSKQRVQYARLKKRLEEVTALDFFSAPERGAAEGALAQLASSFAEAEPERARKSVGQVRGKTWVTRKGVFIDRIACAWVIRRHIDNQAGFKFTADPKYRPKRDELRFDMFDGEFTHRQGKCSFEVMLEEFQLDDPAMLAVSEIIHDIDLKEDRFGRPETAGIHGLFSGPCGRP